MTSLRDTLRSLVYFEGISSRDLDDLLTQVMPRRFVAGEILFLEGEPPQGMWLIERGHIKVYKLNPEGMEHILHLLGPGATFNDIPALDGGPTAANAAALSPEVLVHLIPTAALQHVMMGDSRLALNVVRALAGRIRRLVGQIEDLALYSVIVRLARFLLKQAEDPSLSGPGVTRTAIAAHLNTTPQTISVALRELEDAGAITFDRHRVHIERPDLLRTIAML